MTLKELGIGRSAIVESVGGEGSLRQHFLDMGIIPGVEVTAVRFAPMGDPVELKIHGYELTLRLAEAEQIAVEPAQEPMNIARISSICEAAGHRLKSKVTKPVVEIMEES